MREPAAPPCSPSSPSRQDQDPHLQAAAPSPGLFSSRPPSDLSSRPPSTYQLLPDPPPHPRRRGSRPPRRGPPLGCHRALRCRRLRPAARRGSSPWHGGPTPIRSGAAPSAPRAAAAAAAAAPRPPSQGRRWAPAAGGAAARPREVTRAGGRWGEAGREEGAAEPVPPSLVICNEVWRILRGFVVFGFVFLWKNKRVM